MNLYVSLNAPPSRSVMAGRFDRGRQGTDMPKWARTFMLLTGMLAWLAIVAVSLLIRKIPDAWIIGFPAALWLALTGESRITRRRASRDEPAAVSDREGDSA